MGNLYLYTIHLDSFSPKFHHLLVYCDQRHYTINLTYVMKVILTTMLRIYCKAVVASEREIFSLVGNWPYLETFLFVIIWGGKVERVLQALLSGGWGTAKHPAPHRIGYHRSD